MKRLKEVILCLIVLMVTSLVHGQSVSSENQPEVEVAPKFDSSILYAYQGDSLVRLSWKQYYAKKFLDSMKVDSLRAQLYAPLQVHPPEDKIAKNPDPFNPFIHETFLRVARGRFWFFGLSLFIILYFIYFRAAFSKQMELRFKSFLKKYFFEDLIKEQKVSSAAGSIHAYLIGLLVICQGVLLYIITSEYVRLNSLLTYFVALVAVFVILGLHYILQASFTSSLEMADFWNRQFQRQINVNLLFALILLPVFIILYYNGSKFQDFNLSLLVLTILIIWVGARMAVQFVGLFQDNMLSFVSILYFCTFEIIPYLILFKYITSSL